MTASIRIQRTEQPVLRDHLPQALERRRRSLLVHQKRRVDRARRIVERDDQIERRLPFEPGMAAPVLMQHHPNQRPPWTLLPVRRALHRRPHQARPMQVNLRHRVPQLVAVTAHQLLVEMLHREAGILGLKQAKHPFDLGDRRPLQRGLTQAAVSQSSHALLVKPVPPPPERPLVDPKHLRCFQLSNLPTFVAVQDVRKTHPAQSFVKCCPVHRAPSVQGTLKPDNSRATNTGHITS